MTKPEMTPLAHWVAESRRASETAPGPWHRSHSTQLEVRGAPGSGVEIGGYATRYGMEYEVGGGPPYGWVETVAPGAATETLSTDPDTVALINHEGMPLARTKSGTLTLSEDDEGLYHSAFLDRTDPDTAALLPKIERGDIDEMSFAFRTTDHSWFEHPDHEGDEMSGRSINSFNINRGDVSYVTFGANPHTSIDLRSIDQAVAAALRGHLPESLADLDLSETIEEIERLSAAGGMPAEDGMSAALLQQRQRLLSLTQRREV